MRASEHLRAFQRRSQRSRRLLLRQVSFYQNGDLPKTELEDVFELSFLNIFTSFETQLTEVMKTNMMLSVSNSGRVRSLIQPRSRAQAARILQASGKYIQLLPIENLERVASIYLKDGAPFTLLSDGEKLELRKSYAIRNHIAHKSEDSRRVFKKKIFDQVNLPAHRHSAGYYLRNRITQSRTYFDHHSAELGRVLQTFCSNSE